MRKQQLEVGMVIVFKRDARNFNLCQGSVIDSVFLEFDTPYLVKGVGEFEAYLKDLNTGDGIFETLKELKRAKFVVINSVKKAC
jgi:hypothetical protein